MDPKQIAFILYVNDLQYYEECVRYIQGLTVPEGYSTDIICIQEAGSMAQGYNAGMRASNAKYKIYLHQDTFIVNPDLIDDILKIFRSDDRIGMIGVLGGRRLPDNANCYLSWDTGGTHAYDGTKMFTIRLYQEEKRYVPVEAIDGLIMITQVDLPWREDFLDGWDFYDVSQSLEMRQRGFQIVVPYQEMVWCHHDCGVSRLQDYHFYRHRVIEKYPGYFKEDVRDIVSENEKKEDMEKIEELRSGMIELIANGAYDACCDVADLIRELGIKDTQIREMVDLMGLYSLERAKGDGGVCKWWSLKDWRQIYRCYKELRFALMWRMFKKDGTRVERLLKHGGVSLTAVQYIPSRSWGSGSR